jgi:hypothetical protein
MDHIVQLRSSNGIWKLYCRRCRTYIYAYPFLDIPTAIAVVTKHNKEKN